MSQEHVDAIAAPHRPDQHAAGLRQVYRVRDLIALSVSSVGPLFSIAATGGVMASLAGWWTLPAILVITVPFLIGACVFRLLNQHFPHAGASYHWSARVVGPAAARFQAWILILAYFTSIPPILIPAANYTIALIAPRAQPSAWELVAIAAGWAAFALLPLLSGARPTARFTQAFLALELVAVAAITVIAVARWPQLHVPIHFGYPPIGGMITVSVVAATILDGWEIDSYASEEARRPRTDPGLGGIVGALGALVFYALLYPLMFGETPLASLAGASNPMAVWGQRLIPEASWAMLIPVLASTAGGLWLTSYILTRALYAMSRERLVPHHLARLNKHQAPQTATVLTVGAAVAVVAVQLLIPSLSSFFALVLSAAGFFLVAEFFLDCLTATIFLRRVHQNRHDSGLPRHYHRLLLAASALATAMFAAFLIGFFVYGPRSLGGSIDYVLALLLAAGVVFAYLTRRNHVIYHYAGDDAAER